MKPWEVGPVGITAKGKTRLKPGKTFFTVLNVGAKQLDQFFVIVTVRLHDFFPSCWPVDRSAQVRRERGFLFDSRGRGSIEDTASPTSLEGKDQSQWARELYTMKNNEKK